MKAIEAQELVLKSMEPERELTIEEVASGTLQVIYARIRYEASRTRSSFEHRMPVHNYQQLENGTQVMNLIKSELFRNGFTVTSNNAPSALSITITW